MEFKKPATTVIREFAQANGAAERAALPPQTLLPGRQEGFVQSSLAVANPSGSRADLPADTLSITQITRTIFWASILQTALIWVGIAIFGYPLFAEKFTGTVTDMIEIFSWAFVLDFSLNTLTTLAGGVPAKIKS